MWLFRKKVEEVPEVHLPAPAPPTVEIVAHKNATKEQVEEVKQANENLQRVFERNHFTVKLFVAAGGKPPKAKTGKS